jgi:hypothetical protein
MATIQNFYKIKHGLEAPSQDTISVTDSTYPTIQPSLNLDFENSQIVDERITFTRASRATRYNDKGLVETVVNDQPRIYFDPITLECKGLLIEEQKTNILQRSEDFVNSFWAKQDSYIIPNAILAPNGRYNASKFNEGVSNALHRITNNSLSSGTNTISIYAKAGERTKLEIVTPPADIGFDLVNGTLIDVGYGTSGAKIEIVGNSWYRCSYTYTTSSTHGSGFGLLNASNARTYIGDGSSGIYIWGVQYESGSFSTSYIPSAITFTSRASRATYFDEAGVLRTAGINQPRYGYGYDTPSGKWISQGLILEISATNLHSNGITFSNWIRQSGTTLTSNSAVGPDGFTTAATVVTTSILLGFYDVGISYLANTAYTSSIFVKSGSGVTSIRGGLSNNFEGATAYYLFNLSTKSFTLSTVTGFTNPKASITELSNGWFRISVTAFTGSIGFNSSASIGSFWRNEQIGTAYYYGAQYEIGTTETSYISTFGSTATRSADVSSGSSTTRVRDFVRMNQLYNEELFGYNGFSFLFEFTRDSGNSRSTFYEHSVNVGHFQFFIDPFGSPIYWFINGIGQGVLGNLNISSKNTIAASVTYGGIARVSWNNANPITPTSSYRTKQSTLYQDGGIVIGGRSGQGSFVTVKRLVIYPSTLTNDQLKTLGK